MTKRRGLLLALVTAVVAWLALAGVFVAGWEPKLGLDLQGGFSVRLTAPDGVDREVLDKAVEIMRRRIESLGSVQEPEIAVAGANAVLVQLPGITDRERALAAVGSTGELSFRQVFTIGPLPGVSPVFSELGIAPPGLEAAVEGEEGAGDDAAPEEGTGDDAAPEEGTGDDAAPDTTAAGDDAAAGAGDAAADAAPEPELPPGLDPQTGITLVDEPDADAYLLEPDTGIVYHVGPALLGGADISGADAEFGGGGFSGFGSWVVDPAFTREGGEKFRAATAQLAQFPIGDPRRQFAIVLDGEVVSAPQVAEGTGPEGLSPGNVVITIGGGEDQQSEAEDLATVLRYGALPATFEADRVQAVSATLGSDSLQAGLIAGFGGLFLVGIAMMFYYRALGLIAVAGLGVFGSVLLVLFSALGETQGLTLTLAGVAGIVVAIGITSDSYIVFFERIKEEVRHGRSLRAAVDNAYRRARRTILTADFVSGLGAVLLWILAIGPVKGFAIALGLATLTDVIVFFLFTRPAATWLVRTRLGDGGRATVRGAVGHPAGATS